LPDAVGPMRKMAGGRVFSMFSEMLIG